MKKTIILILTFILLSSVNIYANEIYKPLSNGNFICETDSSYYIINADGNKISDEYEEYSVSKNKSLLVVRKNQLYGIIDCEGNVIIPMEFDVIYPSDDDRTIVGIKDALWYVYDSSGCLVFTKQAYYLSPYSEGLAFVYDDETKYYIDVNGNKVFELPSNVVSAYKFTDNIAIIEVNNKYTYINKNGELIDNLYFDVAGSFHNGYAVVGLIDTKNGIEHTEWSVINKNLEIVTKLNGSLYGKTGDDFGLSTGSITVKNEFTGEENTIQIYEQNKDFCFEETNYGIKITAYNSENSNITVPSYINNMKVVSISANTFYGNHSVTSISLPNSEITLEANAISSCPNLESVYIPNADTVIIDGAISNCPNVTITGKPASTANIYAITNNIVFRATSTQTVRISDVVTDNATGTVHATITNTSGKEFNNIQAIVTLYSNGKMTDTKTHDIEKLPNNDSVGISVKFNTNNIYEYKIFLWESLQTIKPISDVYVPDGIMKSTVSVAPTPTKKYDVSVSNVTTNINAKTISAVVQNSGNESISDAVVYVAAYDNGRLLEAQQCDIASLNAGTTQNITATFKTSDIDDYKIFVWDSATTLKPLSQVTK